MMDKDVTAFYHKISMMNCWTTKNLPKKKNTESLNSDDDDDDDNDGRGKEETHRHFRTEKITNKEI